MDWFSKNYNRLKQICRSISKQNNVDELLHFCIDQIITNPKFIGIEKDQHKYFYFTRVVLNNYNSKTSPYHTTYRNSKIQHLDNYDVEDIIEEENEIDLDWVKNQLEDIKRNQWYYGRLFELYIEEGCSLSKLNKRTTIPLGPLSRDINKVRNELNKKRKSYGL